MILFELDGTVGVVFFGSIIPAFFFTLIDLFFYSYFLGLRRRLPPVVTVVVTP